MKKIKYILSVRKDFGGRLCEIRKRRGISQEELATELGYKTGGSVSNIESGRAPIDTPALAKIAEVLGVDLHWLITGKQSPSMDPLLDKLHEALERFAPYLGDEITRLFQEKIRLTEERKLLSVQPAEDKAVRLELLDKDISRIQGYINETIANLDWIQDPFGKGNSTKKPDFVNQNKT